MLQTASMRLALCAWTDCVIKGTTQACMFRDEFTPLTATGLDIYGLSNDPPKANTSFKNRQILPYTLLCDPEKTLIEAIGLKKAPSGTARGVFVVNKDGKVLAAEPGSPGRTVAVVREIVEQMGGEVGGGDTNGVHKATEEKKVAETAAEVADSAAALDKSKTSTPLPA